MGADKTEIYIRFVGALRFFGNFMRRDIIIGLLYTGKTFK